MNDFPTRLPDSIRKSLPPGVSLFPRPAKKRWVMSTAPDWKQKVLPADVVRPDAALAYVVAYLRERAVDPGAEMERRKVEGPTVSECCDRWLPIVAKRCAPATLKGHKTHCERWIKPAFGSLAIAALDVPGLRAWLRKLREEGKDARTVLHVVSTFRSFYGDAMADGWVNVPASLFIHDGVKRELPKVGEDDPIRLPLEWVQRILDCSGVPLERRARYALAFTSGMRDQEIAGLRLSRLVLDAGVPHLKIEDVVALVGDDGFASTKGTKTKSSRRTMPLHAVAVAALREWIEFGWTVLVGRRPKSDDFLFPRPDGKASRPRSAEWLRADLATAG